MNLTTQQRKVLEAMEAEKSTHFPLARISAYRFSQKLKWSRVNTSLVLQQLKRRGKVKCDGQIWVLEL